MPTSNSLSILLIGAQIDVVKKSQDTNFQSYSLDGSERS